ncbi:PAS domain S-box protein [Fluviispira multicolorata]|uniref:PAS domain S-box protein n=1 Tax=Fluviispira multicolorata TaxID=2654512 RepID=A0A833JFQ2_9BACT|nr:PAS domain S-box protein [Fluviispira multicolorata]KAB8033513.1 PAS domain S-box protein [Fluviispira multicolorata]
MIALPPMRRGILKEVLKIVFLFGALGFTLILFIHFSSKNPKNLISLNFQASNVIIEMFDHWELLNDHNINSNLVVTENKKSFQQSLDFLEKYYSTNDTSIILHEMHLIFDKYKIKNNEISRQDYLQMRKLLKKIMKENQYKLSTLILSRERFSNKMVLLACLIFLIALGFSVYFSERLSSRIAYPIKKISEILQSKPDLNHKLKFPPPETLEIKVLTIEFIELWKRLSDLHKKNLKNLKLQRNELNAVFDSMEDAIVVLDNKGKIEHYNKLFLQIIGAKNESLLYQPWSDVSLSSITYMQLRNLVRNDNFEESNFWAFVDGNETIFRVRKRIINDEDKQRNGVILILHNLSNRYSAAQFKEIAIKLKTEQASLSI